MRPSTLEVMNTLIWTFDEHIAPNVVGDVPSSLAKTMSNMLRYAKLRMQHEPAALHEDNADLRGVIEAIGAYARGKSDLKALTSLAAGAPAPGEFVGLEKLSEEAMRLRAALEQAVVGLQAASPQHGEAKEHKAIRQEIRNYLRRQLKRESAWIDDAFVGPRR